MNILVLASSSQQYEYDKEIVQPVCLSEINGEPIIELLSKSILKLQSQRCIYAFSKHDVDYWNLDAIVEQITPGATVILVDNQTAGALCTALLATPYIDNDDELLIVSSNELINVNIEAIINIYRELGAQAGIMYFDSIHPRYAYARMDKNGHVTEVAERRPISRNAMPGCFWFSKGSDFVQAAKKTILKDNVINGVYYISSTLNEYILNGHKVVAHPIDKTHYIPLKTDRLRELYENFILGELNEN